MLFMSCVCHAFASTHCCVVVICCLMRFCYFPMWYPGSGVVIDCIVSWSLPSLLLCNEKHDLFSFLNNCTCIIFDCVRKFETLYIILWIVHLLDSAP